MVKGIETKSTKEEWKNLTDPYKEIHSKPIHWQFAVSLLTNFHNRIESRIYQSFSPLSAFECMNLLRAISIAFFSQALPTPYRTTGAGLGLLYLWSTDPQGSLKHKISPRENIKEKKRIDMRTKLINSFASAFLINAMQVVAVGMNEKSYGNLLEVPVDITLAVLYFRATGRP